MSDGKGKFWYDPTKGADVTPEVREAAYKHNLNAEAGHSNFTADPLLKAANAAGLIQPGTLRVSPDKPSPKKHGSCSLALIGFALIPLGAALIGHLAKF